MQTISCFLHYAQTIYGLQKLSCDYFNKQTELECSVGHIHKKR